MPTPYLQEPAVENRIHIAIPGEHRAAVDAMLRGVAKDGTTNRMAKLAVDFGTLASRPVSKVLGRAPLSTERGVGPRRRRTVKKLSVVLPSCRPSSRRRGEPAAGPLRPDGGSHG